MGQPFGAGARITLETKILCPTVFRCLRPLPEDADNMSITLLSTTDHIHRTQGEKKEERDRGSKGERFRQKPRLASQEKKGFRLLSKAERGVVG